MTNYDLLAAIGSAEDTWLLELEQPLQRRLPKRFGLIAALVALLLTACAAPVLLQNFDKVTSGIRSGTGNGCEVYVMVNGSRQWKYEGFRSYDAEIQVEANTDAPRSIETQCFPTALPDYCAIEDCEISQQSVTVNCSAKVPRYGTVYGITYQQHVIPESGTVVVPGILGYSYLEQETRTYGDVEALLFHGDINYSLVKDGNPNRGAPTSGNIYSQILFWSDGSYLYCLKLPITYNLPVTEVETILSSLSAVDDVGEYVS